jgi:hypothetical protein
LIPHQKTPVEDERRLFYVAMTRASANLVLSYVQSACACQVESSRFLYEAGLLTKPHTRRCTPVDLRYRGGDCRVSGHTSFAVYHQKLDLVPDSANEVEDSMGVLSLERSGVIRG